MTNRLLFGGRFD